MEDRDINIPESIFENPLFQIALENIPFCGTGFFSKGFSVWEIFILEQFLQIPKKQALHPLEFFQVATKKEKIEYMFLAFSISKQPSCEYEPSLIPQPILRKSASQAEVEALELLVPDNISLHFHPESILKTKIGFHPDFLAHPHLAKSSHYPRKRREQEGKQKTHLQLDHVWRTEWKAKIAALNLLHSFLEGLDIKLG